MLFHATKVIRKFLICCGTRMIFRFHIQLKSNLLTDFISKAHANCSVIERSLSINLPLLRFCYLLYICDDSTLLKKIMAEFFQRASLQQ